MFFIRHIPNFLTCCNIVCGLLGIIQVFNNNLMNAAYFVFAGAFFDFIDGFAARLLKVQSTIGKDLDSLADMVTFGVLPGFVMYKILGIYATNPYLPNIALLIPVFSALRLAKFNNDPRQSVDFFGLPTPANAIFFVSFPLILFNDKSHLLNFIFTQNTLSAIIIIFCLLLVSDLKLFSLKFKKMNWKDNLFPLLLIIISNALFFTLFYTALPLIIILYILLSLVKNLMYKS
ncbi:MAG: CDP-diacylglycerol--serine O-phosphatidyltransferase [Cytophagales bacterium]